MTLSVSSSHFVDLDPSLVDRLHQQACLSSEDLGETQTSELEIDMTVYHLKGRHGRAVFSTSRNNAFRDIFEEEIDTPSGKFAQKSHTQALINIFTFV